MSVNNFHNIGYGLTQALIDIFPSPIISQRNPTVNDKAQYGQVWLNQTNNAIYMLVSIVGNVANWILLAPNAGNLDRITTEDGNVVPPTAGNINLVGQPGFITTVGNIGTSTITVELTGTGYGNVTDVGATPYVVTATDNFLIVDTSVMAITVELPNAPASGRTFTIKDGSGNAAVRNITLTTVGGVVLIDNVAAGLINVNWASVNVVYDGTAGQYWIY